jgi:hypothetical protein
VFRLRMQVVILAFNRTAFRAAIRPTNSSAIMNVPWQDNGYFTNYIGAYHI